MKYVIWIVLFFNFNILHSSDVKISALNQLNVYSDKLNIDLNTFIVTDVEASIDYTEASYKGCQYPNEGLVYGNKIIPEISDPKRVNAILMLIKKIINCEKLPFKQDGQVFYNKEKLLPEKPKGYYREYTLIVPKDAAKEFYIGGVHYTAYPSYGVRGAERIVIGDGRVIYYTPTHYNNFVRIKLVNE